MDDLMIMKVLIRMKDPDDHAKIDQLVAALQASVNDSAIIVMDQYSIKEDNQKALDLLNMVFYVIIAIMMFLCFFSLQASMTANMYE